MPRYVALLRGISVGGHRSLRMETLRAMIEEAGGRDVATSIQSCNEVLTHPARSGTRLATELERVIEQAAGFGREVYLVAPNGLGRSPLAVALSQAKPLAAATVRDGRTVQ